MSDFPVPAASQCSYLNLVLSEKGISEFSNGKRVVFIPKGDVQLLEIKFGSPAERPLLQVAMGCLLVMMGFAGVYLVVNGGIRGVYWGLGLIGFGAIGVFCLYEALKKQRYLNVRCPKGSRKLRLTGVSAETGTLQFIESASAIGYTFAVV